MSVLVIDYDKYLKHENINLTEIIPKESDKYKRGIAVLLYDNAREELEKSKEKLKYFIENQLPKKQEYCFFFYDDKNKLTCVNASNCCVERFPKLLKGIKDEIKNHKLYIYIPFKNITDKTIEEVVNMGFGAPFITDNNNFSHIEKSICMVSNSCDNKNICKKEIENTINQNKEKTCSLKIKFDKDLLEYLKNLCYKEKGEVGGSFELIPKQDYFYVKKVKEYGGQKENVNVEITRYNFHSHPQEAYFRHNVKHAWASKTDFLGCVKMGKKTIFHTITSLEGLYIIQLTNYWRNKTKEIPDDYILENYNVSRKNSTTPDEFVKIINNKKYKNFPIFKVFYFPWSKANQVIKLNYLKEFDNCFHSDKARDAYYDLSSSEEEN